MKIYTKTGDKGKTSLIGGTRISKGDVRLEAYGTVDELNSFVGLLASVMPADQNKDFLLTIQKTLFQVGAVLATDTAKVKSEDIHFNDSEIDRIEKEIDRLNELLPSLTDFIIPGGTHTASLSHVCRTVARRAERCMYRMSEEYMVNEKVFVYVNRLSDYFFVLSRYYNLEFGLR